MRELISVNKKCEANLKGKCSFDCKDCILDDIDYFRKLYNNLDNNLENKNKNE